MNRKIITLLIAVFTVFAFAGTAMAANNVTLKTTVPNIPKSNCDQAGTITQEFDNGTQMQEGDIIQFTLNNNVSLCKTFNFFLLLADEGSELISNDTTDPVSDTAGSDKDYIVVYNQAGATQANTYPIVDTGSNIELGFLVSGISGQQSFTAKLVRRVRNGVFPDMIDQTPVNKFSFTLTTADPATIMTVKLFDEKNNIDYFFKQDVTVTTYARYRTPILDTDNVLCINTSLFNAEYVGATPDSIVADDSFKLGFSGDYTIAHIVAADTYVVELACKDACPYFSIAESVNQAGITSTPQGYLDPGNYNASSGTGTRWSSTYTCAPNTGNGAILYRSGQKLPANSKYSITATLLRNGAAAGSDIVWWGSVTAGTNQNFVHSGTSNYYRTNQSDGNNCFRDIQPNLTSVSIGWKYTSVSGGHITVLNSTSLVASTNLHDGFLIDFPQFSYDYTKLQDGDEIGVLIEFGKQPCGGTVSASICLAIATTTCASTDTYTLLYPYGLGGGNNAWWTGVVITNLNMLQDSTATIYLYDTAGGSGTATVTISPNGQYNNLISGIMAESTYTDGTTPLNSSLDLYVEVRANTRIDGLMFIGDTAVTMMHGYLPRVYNSQTTFTPSTAVH